MYEQIKKKIQNSKAKIGVVGLGYVGLPLAVEFVKSGFAVTGFEIDKRKVRDINGGRSYIIDVSTEEISSLAAGKKLSATSNFRILKDMDVIIICVPTPLRKSKDPDVSYIVSAVDQVKKYLKRGQLIILESTTYPGTTRELVLPKLEKNGFECGKDFFLAFSPERVDPGNKQFNITNTPKVVGGVTPKCASLAKLAYEQICAKVLVVSSTEAAEMVKLLENTFRAVNIALVNEVAMMCGRLKLDVWEIIDTAASKPFGFMPFYPGPGIGGHCIPLDPHYLSWKLKTLNFYSRFIELAGEINSKMPEHFVQKIIDSINAGGKSILRAKVLIFGVAYKKNVNDVRESPALDIITLLEERGAKVSYYDPFVAEVNIGGKTMHSLKNLDAIKSFDASVIVVNHSNVDYAYIAKNSKLVVDSRNATKGIKSPRIVKL